MLAVGDGQGILETILVDKVGDQESRTALLDRIGQIFQCLCDIGLLFIRPEVDQFANDIQNMFLPFLGRDEFLYLVGEEHHPDLVVVLDSRESQCRRDLRNDFFLHYIHGTEVPAARHVDQQHHRQLPFFFEHLHVWADVTCGHVPVNITDIVSVLILAHFAKRHTTPFERRMVLPGKNIA